MARTGRPETPLHVRFQQKIAIDPTTGCWLWTGPRLPQGYGLIKRKDGAQLRAHRVAWELAHGPIPVGLFVCHHCDNTCCVRVDHLFLGTCRDNSADMVAKGRAARNCGERNGTARLIAAEAQSIRSAHGTHAEIAGRFNVSATLIGLIKRRARWKHLP